MSNKNDVVIIELDRPRELRFGHKAIKKLFAMTGKDFESFDLASMDFDEIEKILYCGLLSDARANNETLELNQMEDLLDMAPSYQHVLQKMTEAFDKAFGTSENLGNAKQQPNQRNRSAGKDR